ncbi:hypothetical protein QQX09_04505 [Demequina sp. SYSU T00192]|uniref:Lipoprotein n=1 Tax=Demequina litoralis TaxID=3051660 RepID=A0ABT8G7L4_9MICO|nr:hypothetical protein [Demequina sp. SYSU T00192]MDN4475118.1 hypothetical protein [Demequina sp. SYSU T00192]
MHRAVAAIGTTALVLALAACSADDPEAADASVGAEAAATVEAEASPEPSVTEAPLTIVEQVAADYADEDWAPADSPAFALTADERNEYMELVTAEAGVEEAFADVLTAEEVDGGAMTGLLVEVAEDLSRAGRDIMIVAMLGDSATEADVPLTDDDLVLLLETGWDVCEATRSGTAYDEAFGEAFVDAMTAAMSAGLSTDEEESEAAANTAAAAMMGAMFAHLQCPEFADDAAEAFAQMGDA